MQRTVRSCPGSPSEALRQELEFTDGQPRVYHVPGRFKTLAFKAMARELGFALSHS